MLQNCPKCGSEFDDYSKWGPKKFCSRKCANSRVQTEEVRFKKSKTLSGRTLSKEHKEKLKKTNNEKFCLHCNSAFEGGSKRKFCSKKCWMDNVAQNRTAFENYKHKCKFTFNVYDYADLFDLSLIESYEWYSPANAQNNLSGIARDHKYSISQGFIDNVDPYLISHPMNCELLRHTENQKKRQRCSISLEELKDKVYKFDCERGRNGYATDCNSVS